MTKEKKSKSAKAKKSHKSKHKKEPFLDEVPTRIRLSLKKNADTGKSKSKSKRSEVSEDAPEGNEFDAEMRDAVDNYDYEQEAIMDSNDSTLNIDSEETGNAKIDTSKSSAAVNTNKMILKLKFNLDSPPITKKHKHKHKHHREQGESSSHSRKKVIGKRTKRDSSNEDSDKNGDLFNTDDNESSHARKKAKRHHVDTDVNIEINGESRSVETCGDSVNRHATDKATIKTNVNQSYADNTDQNLIRGAVENCSTDVGYISARDKKGKTALKGVINKVKVEKSQTSNDVKSKEISQYDNNGSKLIDDESENPIKNEIDRKSTLDDNVIKGINSDSKEILMPELTTNTSSYSLREKRSYPPVTEDVKVKADERSLSKSVKNTKAFRQDQASSGIILNTINVDSSITNETKLSIPPFQETKKLTTSNLGDAPDGITTSGIVTKEDTIISSSVGKKGPARKLGRPPKSQESQHAYGFFLEPVDTTIVTDYLTIIQKPMDFGTMRQKIERNEYSSIDEFKEDFTLVCNNCKTYNAPETLYYKSADKLWQFGEKAIERERDSIILEEERMKAIGIAERADIGIRGKRAANVAQGAISGRASSVPRPGRQVRKQRRGEARKQFAPDGSLMHNDPFTLIPQPPPFGETPLLTVISSKTQRQARFEDYGPFATLGVDPPFFTPADKDYLYNIFGDEKGYAYAKSLKAFVTDMGEDMNMHVDKIIDSLTFGVHSLDRQVSRILSNLDPNSPIDTSVIIQTELGPINVGEEIQRSQQLSEIKKKQAELDVWQKDKIDLDFFVSDQEIMAMTKSMGNDQQSFQKMLDLNAQNLNELIKVKQGVGTLESQQKEKQLSSEVNIRLFNLVQHVPKNEISSSTASPLQSNITSKIQPFTQEQIRPQAHLQVQSCTSDQTSMDTQTTMSSFSSTQPQILPKRTVSINSTPASILPNIEQNDPISALAPASILHDSASNAMTSIRMPGRCANCQTTDTPGWRAGETPDQKLCNGIYYKTDISSSCNAFAINKPRGKTSTEVLNTLKDFFRNKSNSIFIKKLKLGHGGTLDPLATGVLVIGVNDGCKELHKYIGCNKVYSATGLFGFATDSYDSYGKLSKIAPVKHITKEMLTFTLQKFTGNILQKPPLYSALRMDGRRLYDYARKGIALPKNIEPREVKIHSLSLLDFTINHDYKPPTITTTILLETPKITKNSSIKSIDTIINENSITENFLLDNPIFKIHVKCGKGTYIRSLVHDIGIELNSAAHVVELVRLQQGDLQLHRDTVELGECSDLNNIINAMEKIKLNRSSSDIIK
ncbi:1500_t:CDS:10 [Scutellospora calospora]|uniref:1500_t:CDS:1 n=1 Tax=Scutellospora calospora TaxID=85575 RepID=A0ACA9K3Y7_9GLOM|nr:1500_t:CDS:10 [Scutellospora calospora]